METDQSDGAIDDKSNPKRPKMETEPSTSSKHVQVADDYCPILSLPPDILAKILVLIPVAQWPSLETLDKNFRAATWIAWRQLRNVNLDRDFMIKSEENANNQSSTAGDGDSVLQKLVERSPFSTSLNLIKTPSLDSMDTIDTLVEFEYLQSVSLGEEKFTWFLQLFTYGTGEERAFTGRRGTPLEAVVELLESSRSRSNLKELQLYDIERRGADRPTILDRFAAAFVNGRNIQSPLMLEKFTFTTSDPYLRIRLDTIDTSRLTELRLGNAPIEPDQLSALIDRASKLSRIELSFLRCPNACDQHLEANKKLLTSLASHEYLSTIEFDQLGAHNRANCVDLEAQFIKMLTMIGRRGRLRKLALGHHFVGWPMIDMNAVARTIRQYIPYLRSIKLRINGITDETVRDLVGGLTELEEIDFARTGVYEVISANVVGNIAHLAHLTRLAIDGRNVGDENSLKCLADLTSLTDLRIGFAHKITADIFDKWSEGFASNLRMLMLMGPLPDRIIEKYERAEEGFVRFLEKTTRLRVMMLVGYVTDRSLMAIAKSCPKLEILGINTMLWHEITRSHFQEIVDGCPKLRKLGLCSLYGNDIGDEICHQLRLSKYRKIQDVDVCCFVSDSYSTEFD